MNIMTKRGSEDNIVTYEHYCDTKADLANIPQDQITLGSVTIVLKDEDDSMGIYLANSNKEWISFSTSGGGSSMSDISLANLVDVSLANPNDGDTLVYDATSEKWIAQAGSGSGGGAGVMFVNAIHGTGVNDYTMDKTFEEISEYITNGGYVVVVYNTFYYPLEYFTTDIIKFGSTIYSQATLPNRTIINSIRYTGFLVDENGVVFSTYEKTL